MYKRNDTDIGRFVLSLLLIMCCLLPVRAQISISAGCQQGTADLLSIQATNVPASTSLTWHSGPQATALNRLNNPSAVSPGIYYAAFFDAGNNCYATASTSVTVTAPLCLSNSCPSSTVNLLTGFSVMNQPVSTSLTWHTSSLASTAHLVTNPASVSTGTYYASFYDSINNCFSPAQSVEVIIKTCPQQLPLVVNPDIALTTPGTPVSGNALTNDSDPNGGTLTAGLTSQPLAGTAVLSPNGSYTYTPPTGFTGVVSFCYSVTSTAGGSGSACVTVTVVPVPTAANDAPVAVNDNTQTTAGKAVTVAVLANDSDPDSATSLNGQLNTPTIVSQPSQGTAVVNANGTVTYTPPVGFTGVVSFPYQVCDRATPALCAAALVTVVVLPAPPANTTLSPVGVDDAFITRLNTPVSGNVAVNDYDPQGLPLTYNSGQPTSGTVVLSPGGSYTYTPAGGYTGPVSFTYSVCNTAGRCDVATVSGLVQPADPLLPLVVNPDVALTNPGVPVSGNVLTNDSDPNGGTLTAGLTGQPLAGTAVLSPNGSYTYTPPTGFTGVVSFCYSVTSTAGGSGSACVTVTVVPVPTAANDAPVAVNDNTQTTAGKAVSIAVLANDSDPDSSTSLNGQLANPTLPVQPWAGTALVNANGTVTYTPPVGFTGVVSFPYQVCDRATPALCATALVTVVVLPAPPANTTLSPVGVDDAFITRLNTPVSGNVAANDYDPQGLPLTYNSGQPTSGTVVLSPGGSYTYTPAMGYTGPVSFTYSVCNTAGRCDVATVSGLVQPDALTCTTPAALTLTPGSVTLITGQGIIITALGGEPGQANWWLSPATGISPAASGTGAITNSLSIASAGNYTITFVSVNTSTPAGCGLPQSVSATTTLTVVPGVSVLSPTFGATTNTSPSISGTATPGSSVTVNGPGGQQCVTVASTAGSWSCVSLTFTPGIQTVTAIAGQNGLNSQSVSTSFTVLAQPTISIFTPVTGSTVSINPVVSGTATPGSSVTLGENGVVLCTTTANLISGAWTCTVNLATGPHTLTAVAQNAGGISLPAQTQVTATGPLRIGITEPGTNTVVAGPTLPVSGTGTPGSSVTLLGDQGSVLCSTIISAAGNWSCLISLSDGLHTLTAVAGNASSTTSSQPVTITVVTPPGVAIVSPANGTTITTTNAPVSGTATPGSSVTVTAPGGQLCVAVANAAGSWTCTSISLTQGAQSITAVAGLNGISGSAVVSSFTVLTPGLISLQPRVYLQGALLGVYLPDRLMRDDLRRQGLLPSGSPYAALTPVTATGSVSGSVYTLTGADAIVDWVFVELRSSSNPVQVMDSRAALLQRDGDVVDLDGRSPLTFSSARPAGYFVVVRHRNHLAVMSQGAIPLSATTTVVDFTLPSTPTYTYQGSSSSSQGSIDQSQVVVEQGVAMWAGNSFTDNNATAPHDYIIYQGSDNDVNVIYQQVVNPAGPLVTPFTIRKGYLDGDVNLDGKVIFQGTQNDVEFIYQNIIKNHPGNILQVPFFKIREQKP